MFDRISACQVILAEVQKVLTRVTILCNGVAGGLALGLTEPEMRHVVLALSRRDFYKAMTTHSDYQVWQDVYHGMTLDGVSVYIKITGSTDGRPPVIQFKAK